MLKKLTALSAILLLAGCQNLGSFGAPKMAYKLSDEDAKKWIIEENKREQCVFPKEYAAKNLNNLSPEERQLHFNGVILGSLTHVIGAANARLAVNDPASYQYLQSQRQKFNHSEKASFDPQWCEAQKRDYSQALKQVRENMAKQKAQALAQQKEAERQRKAEAEFYASKEGQAYMAQQQMMAQQQAMQNQMQLQQQQQMQAQRAAYEQAQFQQFTNAINNGINSMSQTYQQRAAATNALTQSMMANPMPTPVYRNSPQSSSSSTCYPLPGGIVRCNHQ